jgi:hypothetical protein
MDYGKQLPLTEDQLLELRSKSKGYTICNLKHYPDNRVHLEARLPIATGFSITRNMDGYILKYVNGESVLQPENKWVVMADDSERFPGCFEHNEVFDNPQSAVEYVYIIRKIQLQDELNKIDELSMAFIV